MAKAPRIGDIFEISTPAGLAYVQHTHETKEMGQLIRVLPGLFHNRPVDFPSLAQQKELYFIFYPLEGALRAKQTFIVSHAPVPDWAQTLPTMRHPGMEDETGKPAYWLIIQAGTSLTLDLLRSAPKVYTLTPEQEKLSLNLLAPHPSLVDKISSGWIPGQVEKRRKAAVAREEVSNPVGLRTNRTHGQVICHYLYFSNESTAEKAAVSLREIGETSSVRKSADGENWLVLACHPAATAQEAENGRADIEAVAVRLGGEYDGWEWGPNLQTNGRSVQ
jgi:hypothetical protein